MRPGLCLLALLAAAPAAARAQEIELPLYDPSLEDAPLTEAEISALLAKARIENSPAGAVGFLKRQVAPAAPAEKVSDEKVRTLIASLGNDDFSAREAATKALREIGAAAEALLKEAAAAPDPEIRSRAEGLLAELAPPGPDEKSALHDAVMALLQRHPPQPGAAEALADFWPRFQGSAAGRTSMIRALGAAAGAEKPGEARLKAIDRLISVLEGDEAEWEPQNAATTALRALDPAGPARGPRGWRRWYVSIGGKPPTPPAEVIPEEAIVVNLGFPSPEPGPSIEVAGARVGSFDEAARAIEAEAKRRKAEGQDPFVLVRHPPGLEGSALSALLSACRKAGIETVRQRPIVPAAAPPAPARTPAEKAPAKAAPKPGGPTPPR